MMKKGIAILIAVFLSAGTLVAILTAAETARPPGSWTKYIGNPVVITGTAGSWDAKSVGDPTVIFDNMLYEMWYNGTDASDISSIGYATSTNGISWTKYASNPVITGTTGSWDANVLIGDVVFDGATYRMWYWGADGISGGIFAVGYATSTNGITWTKYASNPIITGTAGSWDSRLILCPTVISVSGLFEMWYTGIDDIGIWSIGYLTSTDGISWSKQSSPVLQTGSSGSWDASRVICPEVVLDDAIYRMWYTGEDASGTRRIGQASSSDGVSWAKSSNNPVLGGGAPGSWDTSVMQVGVILEGNAYKMWYSGAHHGRDTQIGYARAVALTQLYLPVVMKSSNTP